MSKEHEHWMRRALQQAEAAASFGEVPIGAVLTWNDRFVVAAYNERERLRDPIAHAEMSVIRMAAQELGRWRLLDATLYVTLEPCAMCAGALVNSRIKRLVYGAADPKAGGIVSVFKIADDPRLNHRVEIVGGILDEGSRALLQRFFRERRQTDSA